MRKALRTKIENWILADLAIEPSDYYQLLARSPETIHPFDFWQCLEQLTTTGQILKLKSTPNPTYKLCPTTTEK